MLFRVIGQRVRHWLMSTKRAFAIIQAYATKWNVVIHSNKYYNYYYCDYYDFR